MSEETHPSLYRLERRVKVLSFAVGLLAVLFIVSLLPVFTPDRKDNVVSADEVTARRFTIQDDNNAARIVLSVDKEVGPCLYLKDRRGSIRAILAHDDGSDATYLQMGDGRGNTRVDIAHYPGEGSVMRLWDGEGHERGKIAMQDDGICSLSFLSTRGQEQIIIAADASGDNHIHLLDKGTTRVGLVHTPGGVSGLTIMDGAGKGRAMLSAWSDGGASLIINDEKGLASKFPK